MPRTDHATNLQRSLGSESLEIVELQNGWPTLCKVRSVSRWRPVALFVGRLGLSHRGRDDVERRFQNPGKDRPMHCPPGYHPVLVGLSYSDERELTVIVGMDPMRRLGLTTRFSMFVPLETLRQAAVTGWVDHVSTSEETVHILRPELFPVLASLTEPGSIAIPEVGAIVEASGLLDDPEDSAAVERARVAALRVARRSDFGKKVVDAYGGHCSMCGLDSGLVDGAHIYPVQAPSSPDRVWNGIALCPNHHRAFDRHAVFVEPESLSVTVHPDLQEAAESNEACAALLSLTRETMRAPGRRAAAPRPEMFQRRYEYFDRAYRWAL